MKSWKFFLTTLFICSIVLALAQVAVYAGTDETNAGLTVMASDDFTATEGTDLCDYTGGEGWIAGSKYYTNAPCTTQPAVNIFKLKGGILTPSGTTGGGGFNLFRRLAAGNEINFNTNMDYYIRYQTVVNELQGKSIGVGPFAQYLKLIKPGTTPPTNDAADGGAGIAPNFTLNGLGPISTYFGYPGRYLPLDQNYTVLWYIGARTGSDDIMKVKVFGPSDTFTYTPDSWDAQVQINLTYVSPGIALTYSNGTGSNNARPRFDNVIISKASPIIITKTGGTYSYTNPVIGEIDTVTIPSQNLAGHDQVIKSCDWYMDYDETSFLTNNVYTVTDDMLNRKLRCKVVISDISDPENPIDKTYWPINDYVRGKIDVSTVVFTCAYGGTNNNQNIVKLNSDGHLDNLSTMKVRAVVSKNHKEFAGTAKGFTAIYKSDGTLKSVTSGSFSTGTTNGVSQLAYTYQPSSEFAAGSFDEGDYVKVFVWDSVTNIKPLSLNQNLDIPSFKFPAQ